MEAKRFQFLVERDPTFLEEITLKTKDYLDRTSIAIDRELERYSNSRFFGPLKYALEGGKRIRPMIALLSAESVGSKDDSVLDAAVAVELLHAESIIHDDIIDQEVSRRGKAAFHVRYGYSASLLTADFVFAMILAIASRYQDRRVAHTLSKAALQMCEGEYMELTIDPMTYKLGWDEYIDIIYNKTGALFQTATELGRDHRRRDERADRGALELRQVPRHRLPGPRRHARLGGQGQGHPGAEAEQRGELHTHRAESLTDSYSKKAKEQLGLIAGRQGARGFSGSSQTSRSRETSSVSEGRSRARRPARRRFRSAGRDRGLSSAPTGPRRPRRRVSGSLILSCVSGSSMYILLIIHDVVAEAEGAVQDAGHGEPGVGTVDDREEEQQLAPEAVQRRHPGERQHRDREREGGDRGPLREPLEGPEVGPLQSDEDEADGQERGADHDRVVDDLEERPGHPERPLLANRRGSPARRRR